MNDMTKPSPVPYLGTAFALLASYGVLLFEDDTVLAIAGREQPIEWFGAAFFLAASAISFAAYRFTRRRPKKPFLNLRHAFLPLAIFFFVAFGEEVSWGQHIFKFEAPEGVAKLNEQGEFNLHNLKIIDTYGEEGRRGGLAGLLTSNRLFDYFMITLFILIPAAKRFVPFVRREIERRQLPVSPGLFATALVANWALTVLAELTRVHSMPPIHGAVSEIREFNYAALCFLVFLYFWSEERRAWVPSSSP